MKNWILIFALMLLTATTRSQCLTADIVIIVDWSSSESGNEARLARATREFIAELDVSDDKVRVGILTFNNVVTKISKLNGDKTDLNARLGTMTLFGAKGGTWISESIMETLVMFNNERAVPKLIVILSDGEIPDVYAASRYISEAKEHIQLSVYAVQIAGHDIDPDAIDNLYQLTGDPTHVEIERATGLSEALKRLNLCN